MRFPWQAEMERHDLESYLHEQIPLSAAMEGRRVITEVAQRTRALLTNRPHEVPRPVTTISEPG